jgi:hypothetical protein
MGLTVGQAGAVKSIDKAKFRKLAPARLVGAIHMFIKAQNQKGKMPIFPMKDDKTLQGYVKDVAIALEIDATSPAFKSAVSGLKAEKFDIRKSCPLFANDNGEKANGEYLGGNENEPHVHVYGGGFHLKLGSDRYNIVQGGKLYEGKLQEAHAALKSHPLKTTLAPFVAAALKKFGFL